jgi:putative membrane protein
LDQPDIDSISGGKVFLNKRFLETKSGKAIYVATVTVVLSAVGSWAVLAHPDSPTTPKKDQGSVTEPRESSKASAKTSMAGDSRFAKEAAQGGMAEVKLGQLAQGKGSNDAVKSFGKRMVDDHSKAGDKLKETAAKENVTLPTDISAKDQATYDRLSKLNGAAFDRAYAKDMVKDHQTDVAAFQKEANGGKSESLKSFASETLPTLQDHLKEAKKMMKTVGGTTAGKSTKPESNPSR